MEIPLICVSWEGSSWLLEPAVVSQLQLKGLSGEDGAKLPLSERETESLG